MSSINVCIYGNGNIGMACKDIAMAQGASVVMLPRFENVQNLKPDYLFLCAGPTGDFRVRVLDTFDAAVTQTIRLIRDLKPKKIIGVSSVRLYGFQEGSDFFDESSSIHTDHTKLDFSYDGAKQSLENILLFGAKEAGAESVIVRLSNIVGGFIRDGKAAMLHHAIRAAKKANKIVETKQNLKSTKDYLHVKDAASGLWLAATKGSPGEIYNIASGISLSVEELCAYLGVVVKYIGKDDKPTHSRISVKKAVNELGYTPNWNTPELIANSMVE